VDLALVHGEVETLEDFPAVDGDVQILDFQHRHFVSSFSVSFVMAGLDPAIQFGSWFTGSRRFAAAR
jgi:hypothetical protein